MRFPIKRSLSSNSPILFSLSLAWATGRPGRYLHFVAHSILDGELLQTTLNMFDTKLDLCEVFHELQERGPLIYYLKVATVYIFF